MSVIRGTRTDHCTGERYATYADASPVLVLLNGPRRDRWTATQCAICRGWHLVAPKAKTETTNVR